MASERSGPPVFCLMGPTAAGKTALALELVRRFPLEIVSVDSAQVYRGLDIGTAKPGPGVLADTPHHLIDVCSPTERYSAGRFREDALAAVRRIHDAGRIPLLAGGTMLYFQALQRGLASMPVGDARVRRQLDAEAQQRGWPELHRQLRQVDVEAAARIAPADRQRIQRALEVYRLTGVPISRLRRRLPAPPPYRFVNLGLLPGDRARLGERIASRFRDMMAAGLLAEVARLRRMPGMHTGLPAARLVGYRQLWAHLEGECSEERAVAQAVAATRQLAKRQLTWLRTQRLSAAVDPLDSGNFGPITETIGRELRS